MRSIATTRGQHPPPPADYMCLVVCMVRIAISMVVYITEVKGISACTLVPCHTSVVNYQKVYMYVLSHWQIHTHTEKDHLRFVYRTQFEHTSYTNSCSFCSSHSSPSPLCVYLPFFSVASGISSFDEQLHIWTYTNTIITVTRTGAWPPILKSGTCPIDWA